MKLDRVKITGLSAIALVGIGTGIGLALNGGHSNTPASPVVVKEVAATSSAKTTTPAPSPTKSVLAPTVAVKKPAASAREVAPVIDPITPDPTSQAPAPVPVESSHNELIVVAAPTTPGEDGVTRAPAGPGIIQSASPIAPPPPGDRGPSPTPSASN